jgi:hypothetical protein
MLMQQTDLDGLRRLGHAARLTKRDYWDNPFYFNDAPLPEWMAMCNAWSAGWLEADAGRSKELLRLLALPSR